ncbi:MAG: M28 family peptidase [Bacteroidales bacterium]|nr:M28 family peptidase [Bacteroidales bacterium]
MKKIILLTSALLCMIIFLSTAQTNMKMSNIIADQIVKGNYNPANYTPAVVINNPDSIINGVVSRVSRDTLLKKLDRLQHFHNRNTSSDTISDTNGIGATRKWLYSELQNISAANENRLVVSYLTFDATVNGKTKHKNVIGVLPGLDTTDKQFIVLQGHFDTRCEGANDINCATPGADDNGSGTVLVLELARIMCKYSYNHTIVFALLTGEDQGLYGGIALATYFYNNSLPVMACFNNDVVSGVICGQTSSPPGCSPPQSVDSIDVRVYSYSTSNDSDAVSPYKQLARYIKLHQIERINPLISTKMNIEMQIVEDRTGRSGDHIPYRQKNYTAVRVTSHNENGNGSGTAPDRDHTTRDSIGRDTSIPKDGIYDIWYIDMNYLKRNAITNGVNVGLLAVSPPKPAPAFTPGANSMKITMQGKDTVYNHYRVGIRKKGSGTLYFDTVLTFYTDTFTIKNLQGGKKYFFSVMNVENTVESIFANEQSLTTVGIYEKGSYNNEIELKQNYPNPNNGETVITVIINRSLNFDNAFIIVKDLPGREIKRIPVELKNGNNNVIFKPAHEMKGIYTYSLEINGKIIQTKKMVIL